VGSKPRERVKIAAGEERDGIKEVRSVTEGRAAGEPSAFRSSLPLHMLKCQRTTTLQKLF